MKLLFISNTILGKRGNIGYRLQYLIDEIDSKEIFIISRGECGPKTLINYILSKFIEFICRVLNAIRIYLWRDFPQKVVERKIFFIYFLIVFYKNFKKTNNTEILYTTDMNSHILKFCKKRGMKIILDMPIAPSNYAETMRLIWGDILSGNPSELESESYSLNLADDIIVPSEFVSQEVSLVTDNSAIHIIPFGVNLDAFSSSHFRSLNGNVRFIFAGTISRRKGLLYMLDAWHHVHNLFPTAELHLCGRVYPDIKNKIKNLGCNKNIFTPGFVNLEKYFKETDIYIFPSLMEGSSKSTYEAMASGLPVITTFESGSIVDHGVNGLIIPKCSSEAISSAMLLFLQGKVNYEMMSRNAYSSVQKYTWKLYANKIKCIIWKKNV